MLRDLLLLFNSQLSLHVQRNTEQLSILSGHRERHRLRDLWHHKVYSESNSGNNFLFLILT